MFLNMLRREETFLYHGKEALVCSTFRTPNQALETFKTTEFKALGFRAIATEIC